MSIRLDPRRLNLLKQLAGEAGVRPGELVLVWVEERLDAERHGGPVGTPAPVSTELLARIDDLTARVATLEAAGRPAPPAEPIGAPAATDTPAAAAEQTAEAPSPPRRGPGRPRTAQRAPRTKMPAIPLHEEIEAVIAERGPASASEIAQAIVERGRYAPPRSGKPLDAATVNSRVSNPVYRARFARQDGRITLANTNGT
jgi:hypothetical protein